MQFWYWLLITSGIVFSKDMLEQEADLTIQLIQKLENKIEKLEEIRANLLSSETAIPVIFT
jgi:hypothetical protein